MQLFSLVQRLKTTSEARPSCPLSAPQTHLQRGKHTHAHTHSQSGHAAIQLAVFT